MRAWVCAVVLVVAACGGAPGTGDDAQPDATGSGGDGSVGATWTSLISRNWQLAPISEAYKCKRILIKQDTWIAGIRSLQPTGTHHEVLTISTIGGTMGDYDCNAGEDLQKEMLYGGGTNTGEFVFPAGVGMKLSAGSYLNLTLHVANFSDGTLDGTSGLEVLMVPGSSVVNEADMMFLGTFDLHIPATNSPWVEPGSCSAPAEWHIFNLWPHMHKYATHQKVTVRRDNSTTDTLLDADYSVNEQRNYPMAPVLINANDLLWVDCTYVNDTNITYPPGMEIQYGEGALAEMCFAGFYKYPTGGKIYDCSAL